LEHEVSRYNAPFPSLPIKRDHAPTPRNDFVFKRLFGDARDTSLLTEFLKSTLDLPAEDYQEVRIVDPHLKGERPEDKEGILDVKVKTPSGNQRTED
jgi:predicted transposase/invertase (TIGR01784 family)